VAITTVASPGLHRHHSVFLAACLLAPVLVHAQQFCACVSNQLDVEVNYSTQWSRGEERQHNLAPRYLMSFCWSRGTASPSTPVEALLVVLTPNIHAPAARESYNVPVAASAGTECKDIPRSSWYNIAYQAGSNGQRVVLQSVAVAASPPPPPPKPPEPTIEPRLMGSGGRS
jgi:hypothetical protein